MLTQNDIVEITKWYSVTTKAHSLITKKTWLDHKAHSWIAKGHS